MGDKQRDKYVFWRDFFAVAKAAEGEKKDLEAFKKKKAKKLHSCYFRHKLYIAAWLNTWETHNNKSD